MTHHVQVLSVYVSRWRNLLIVTRRYERRVWTQSKYFSTSLAFQDSKQP